MSSTKLVLSNVSPTLPNNVISNHLKNALGLELTSPVSILRVSPSNNDFGHVICWRRQVYIKSSNTSKIPPSFVIEYNNRSHRIFVTYDEYTCFKCGNKGHRAEDCLVSIDFSDENLLNSNINDGHQNTNESITSVSSPPATKLNFPQLPPTTVSNDITLSTADKFTLPPAAQITSESTTHPHNNQIEVNTSEQTVDLQHQTTANFNTEIKNKRPMSNTSSSTTSSLAKPAVKKLKEMTAENSELSSSNSTMSSVSEDNLSDSASDYESLPSLQPSLKQIFAPVENFYQENQQTKNYPISFQNFVLLFDMCKGKPDIIPIIQNFTNDTNGIYRILRDCYPLLTHKGTKNRFTRISKKLEPLLQQHQQQP